MEKKWCWLTKASKKNSTNGVGAQAELFAKDYIQRRGLKFLANNVSYPFGEIDLIAEDGGELVFIEVRFRSDSLYGAAVDTVQAQKQKRLVLAANRWLADNQTYQNHYCRFDLIAIDSVIDAKHTRWEKNAFQTPGYP